MEKVFMVGVILAICGCIRSQVPHKESFCGVKGADHSKTCISVRLPWQEAPIYFCTEKVNIPFKDRCTDQLARYCPTETSNSSLVVATPWDCCALSSTPDICADRSCPSAPFNRTCREIEPDVTRPWECCPTFFCEEDQSLSSCQMKRLEPSCLTPPKNKKNCVTFKDEHGCCNKFQCEGEGKQGKCPMEVQAQHFRKIMEKVSVNTSPASPRAIFNSTLAPSGKPGVTSPGTTTLGTSTALPPLMDTRNGSENGSGGGLTFLGEVRSEGLFGQGPITTDLRCVGDYNCPGAMKCCSPVMTAYYDYGNSGRGGSFSSKFGSTKDKAIYGQCVEPVFIGKEGMRN